LSFLLLVIAPASVCGVFAGCQLRFIAVVEMVSEKTSLAEMNMSFAYL